MNKKENKPQEEAKKQDKSQNQPKESFIGTGNGYSLRSRTGTWFECKVRYEKTQEDGSEKLVNELYVVDALKSIERAKRYVDEVMGKTIIDYELKSLSESKIMDVFEYHDSDKAEDSNEKKKSEK